MPCFHGTCQTMKAFASFYCDLICQSNGKGKGKGKVGIIKSIEKS